MCGLESNNGDWAARHRVDSCIWFLSVPVFVSMHASVRWLVKGRVYQTAGQSGMDSFSNRWHGLLVLLLCVNRLMAAFVGTGFDGMPWCYNICSASSLARDSSWRGFGTGRDATINHIWLARTVSTASYVAASSSISLFCSCCLCTPVICGSALFGCHGHWFCCPFLSLCHGGATHSCGCAVFVDGDNPSVFSWGSIAHVKLPGIAQEQVARFGRRLLPPVSLVRLVPLRWLWLSFACLPLCCDYSKSRSLCWCPGGSLVVVLLVAITPGKVVIYFLFSFYLLHRCFFL